jgi:hypothetical protein
LGRFVSSSGLRDAGIGLTVVFILRFLEPLLPRAAGEP